MQLIFFFADNPMPAGEPPYETVTPMFIVGSWAGRGSLPLRASLLGRVASPCGVVSAFGRPRYPLVA